MYPDNLSTISQNFQTTEVVTRFSLALGESLEKTRTCLKTVIPTLLFGLITRTEADPGPEHLVHIVKQDGIEMKQISKLDNEEIMTVGSDALSEIFGQDLDVVAGTLGQSLGVESRSIKTLMGLSAPFVMGMIGHKMRREGLSPAALAGYLSEQKNSLNLSGLASDHAYGDKQMESSDFTEESPLFALLLVAILMAILIWWSNSF